MKTTYAPLSPQMALARAEGRKTQTRRIVKLPFWLKSDDVVFTRMQDGFPDGLRAVFGYHDDPNAFSIKPPYGLPGDRIGWLTTWASEWAYDDKPPREMLDDAPLWSYHDSDEKPAGFGKLRPGRFLPGFLRDRMPSDEIVSVRVVRLQDITEEDLKAEGIDHVRDEWVGACGDFDESLTDRQLYEILWDHINGPGSWNRNDQVWRIEFRRVEK